MTAIADFRTKILALLDDPTLAKYTADQVDQALRETLTKYNNYRPVQATYVIDGTNEQRIELPFDFPAIAIIRVEYPSDPANPSEDDAIPFYAYKTDGHWFIETRTIYTTAQSLTIFYTISNYIDGLDAGAGTSIPAEDVDILALGAAGFAAITRANSRAEAINLVPNEAQELRAIAQQYLNEFSNYFVTEPKNMIVATWVLDTGQNY